MTQIYDLTEVDLPENLRVIQRIFDTTPNAVIDLNERQSGETLHDYLTRKGITCGCRACRDHRKREAIEEKRQKQRSIGANAQEAIIESEDGATGQLDLGV